MENMFEKLKDMVLNAEKIAVFAHENPDGDALGSSFAFALGLMEMDKKARVFLGDFDGDTKEYMLIRGKEKMADISPDECDLKVALDCADFQRISLGGAEFTGETAAVDHHITHIPYAKETVVEDAPATGEIVFDILSEWKVEITEEIADDLYIAIACDTGNFKYASTTPKTHRIAARLIECGAAFADIARELFYKKPMEYYALFKIALDRTQLFENGRACIMYLSDEDFEKAGISDQQAGDIVTLPTKIEGVEIGAYIRKRKNGFKVSLRSNEHVDVAKIAVKFGGGGHIRAAGFSSELPIDELMEKVKTKITEALLTE